MKIDEFIKQLKCYLESSDATYLLSKRKELFIQVINKVKEDVIICEKNEWKETSTIPIIESLEYLLAVLNEQPISIEASKFIESYSTLLYNHNENTNKSEKVNLLTQTVNRFITLRMTTMELIQNLKIVSKMVKELSHVGFQPTQLSKHYLASFDKQNQ
jgi:hypothetical protein